MLKTRIFTGAILSVFLIGFLLFSHIPWVMSVITSLLCIGAVCELYRATGIMHKKCVLYVTCCASIVISFIPSMVNAYIMLALLIMAGVLFTYLMRIVKSMHSINIWMSVVLAATMVYFLNSMGKLRAMEQGTYLLGVAILTPVLTDVFAYLLGRVFGKHKLAPMVSPKKTIEGSIGGTAVTVLVLILIALILDSCNVLQVQYCKLTIYLLMTSLIAQFGDLSLSSVKRIVRIKDYGKLLPGHGGVLDRFDSWLFAMPFTYLFCTFVGPMFI